MAHVTDQVYPGASKRFRLQGGNKRVMLTTDKRRHIHGRYFPFLRSLIARMICMRVASTKA